MRPRAQLPNRAPSRSDLAPERPTMTWMGASSNTTWAELSSSPNQKATPTATPVLGSPLRRGDIAVIIDVGKYIKDPFRTFLIGRSCVVVEVTRYFGAGWYRAGIRVGEYESILFSRIRLRKPAGTKIEERKEDGDPNKTA